MNREIPSIRVHTPYYRNLIKVTSMSYSDRKYYSSVLDSIDRQSGLATTRQKRVLTKMERGY